MDVDEGCIDILEAILARGINDVTSWGWVQAIFFLVYGTLMIMGLIGNGGVLFAVLNNRRLRSARNIFLLNLILADILLCLTAIPVTPWYGITKDWQFGSLMCRLMPLSNSCSVFVTSWSLTAIAIDKFIHIIDPTRASVSVRKATLLTLFIWLICSLINVPYLMSYELVDGSFYVNGNQTPFCGRFCDEINWHGDTPRQLYGSAVMLLQFVVPLTIITYCYCRILQKVATDMIVHNSQFCASLSIAQRLEASNRKKRVNYILIGMVIAFIGCWLPLTAVNLVKDFQKEPKFLQQQPYLWPLIAHVIAMSTVIWNPLLFFWLTRRSKHPILRRIRASSDAFSHFLSRLTSFRRQSTFASRISQSSIGYRTSRRACIRAGDTIASQGHPLLARLSTPGHRIDKVIMIRKMTH